MTSIKQVTGGKGTLKRRRQLHDLMEAVNADDNDDYFASAPGLAAVAAKRAKHLDFSVRSIRMPAACLDLRKFYFSTGLLI